MSELHATFEKVVDEAEERLGRTWPSLLATGTMRKRDLPDTWLRAAAMLLALLAAACTHPTPDSKEEVRISTRTGVVTVHAEVADTDAERSRGLSGRATLAPDAGMAFLFPGPVRDGFWMKDTSIPLSIAFWDPSGRIVAILDMPPCRVDPCPTYRPQRSFVGALETNRGFFERHGVEEGDRVRTDLLR